MATNVNKSFYVVESMNVALISAKLASEINIDFTVISPFIHKSKTLVVEFGITKAKLAREYTRTRNFKLVILMRRWNVSDANVKIWPHPGRIKR